MLSDRYLSCLSVTLVYCGQTVGWIKMKLGMEVGLGPGNVVLDGDPAPPKRDTAPSFRPMFIVDKDATWYGSRPRPRPHCVRRGPSSPPAKGAQHAPPLSSAHVYWGYGRPCQLLL